MLCKLCEKEIEKEFYRHLNSYHSIKSPFSHNRKNGRMTMKRYFELFPEQREEYEKQKKGSWNKGLTKETNSTIAKMAITLKEHCSQEYVRSQRSERMKKRYEFGDIMSPENRAIVVKKGSDGWVRKLKSLSYNDRKEVLKNFTTAGNLAQQERRAFLTPEDYERLYPIAKGKARYYNCDDCGKQMIAWFGGKPRPKKRFCDNLCWSNYRIKHAYSSKGKGTIIYYHSKKMNVEFCLRSKLERNIAEIFDESNVVNSWSTTPFHIEYYYLEKKRRYYPDFFFNSKFVLEVKSTYIFEKHKDICVEKFKAANLFCKKNGYEFLYWQFGCTGRDEKVRREMKQDERLQFLLA